MFTVEELKAFDGTDESQPVYIALKGIVFDVTARREMYAPGQGYSIFAGRDASKVRIGAYLYIYGEKGLPFKFEVHRLRCGRDLVPIGCSSLAINCETPSARIAQHMWISLRLIVVRVRWSAALTAMGSA